MDFKNHIPRPKHVGFEALRPLSRGVPKFGHFFSSALSHLRADALGPRQGSDLATYMGRNWPEAGVAPMLPEGWGSVGKKACQRHLALMFGHPWPGATCAISAPAAADIRRCDHIIAKFWLLASGADQRGVSGRNMCQKGINHSQDSQRCGKIERRGHANHAELTASDVPEFTSLAPRPSTAFPRNFRPCTCHAARQCAAARSPGGASQTA